MLLVSKTLNTDGSGYWSDRTAKVTVTGLNLSYLNDRNDFGELRVFFDTQSWNTETDGLIYTDRQFLKELSGLLESLDLATDVDYSEQGMQGFDYVSLDVGPEFIRTFKSLQA